MEVHSLHKEVNAIIGEVPPTVGLNDVKVEVRFGEMLSHFCDDYYQSLEYGYNKPLPFSLDELKAFIEVAIEQRVRYVNGQTMAVKASDFTWKTPCFVHFILSQIGKVEMREYQLVLTPTFGELTMEKFIPCEKQEFIRKMSSWLDQLASASVAKALPKHIDGDRDFMSLTVVESIVRGPNAVAQPAMTLAASFVEATRAHNALTAHVTYAPTVYYKQFIPPLARIGMKWGRDVS